MDTSQKTPVATPAESDAAFLKMETQSTTPAAARRPPFVRRGFGPPRHNAEPGINPEDGSNLGALERLPLSIQVAFRRKLLGIIALQLSIVILLIIFVRSDAFGFSLQLDDAIDGSPTTVLTAFLAFVVSLIALHVARSKHPYNWIILGIFTTSEALCFAQIASDPTFVLLNLGCVFGWVVFMLACAGWTTTRPRQWWSGGPLQETDDSTKRLVDPFVPGILGLVIEWTAIAIHSQTSYALELSPSTLGVSAALMLVICGWFIVQITHMTRTMPPDEYMRGVIYLYANLLTALGALVAIMLCFGTCGPDIVAAAAVDASTTNNRDDDAVV